MKALANGCGFEAKIDQITFWDRDNLVVFDDTDSSTDYFHGAGISMKQMLEWVLKDGAGMITVDFGNNEEKPKFHQRLKRLEQLGYAIQRVEEERTGLGGHRWKYVYYRLTKAAISSPESYPDCDGDPQPTNVLKSH